MTWIQTRSGKKFSFVDLDEDAIVFGDIAFSLAHTNRFTGHAGTYSVAEHSYLLAEWAIRNGHEPNLAAALLMHDAPEAYLGDWTRPLKMLFKEPVDLEAKVWKVIADKYSIDTDPATEDFVHRCDGSILEDERRHFFPENPEPWKLEWPPLGIHIYQWEPEVARKAFVSMARLLDIV